MSARIHLFGASGSGTTTLGRAVANAIDAPFYDTDDYFWRWDCAPFTQKRPAEERLSLLGADMALDSWVSGGSLCGWGDPLIPRFTLAAFLYTPQALRLERIKRRETKRFGDALLPGGAMYRQHMEFLDWAARYDTGGLDMRSLAEHEKWIASLPCKTIRLDGALPLEKLTEIVLRAAGVEGAVGSQTV